MRGRGMALAFALLAGSAAAAQVLPVIAPPALIDDLVLANHILVDQGIIDVRGHVSVRDPADPQHFFLARAIAPGLVARSDIQAFDLDGNLVGGDPKQEAYSERFIHARIYRARPDVRSIVHAHTRSLIAFSVSDIKLRPVVNSAIFIGNKGVAISANGKAGAGLRDAAEGDALARDLGQDAAVLMQGHGMVVVATSIQSAVGRSVALDIDAQVLANVLATGGKPTFLVAPPDAAAQAGNFAREWDWWKAKAPR